MFETKRTEHHRRSISNIRMWFLTIAAALVATVAAPHTARAETAETGRTVDVGETGYDTKRLVMASACPHACPWGELGEFVQEAMDDEGYEIILCRNCNRAEGPRIVAKAAHPPELIDGDIEHGTLERVDAPIDFGVTEANMFRWAYNGQYIYAKDGPYPNLRLIARIEDPTYLLVAAKAELGIESLAEIRERKLPVRILADFQPSTIPVLEHYGLDKESLASWGGELAEPNNVTGETPFDVIISSLASPANNPESDFWTILASTHDLDFLDLPEELLEEMANEELGMQRVTARWGVLRGVDRAIETVGRSGEVIMAREDMPDEIAYTLASAIDHNRDELKWFVRPYSIDPNTVWDGKGVPLHPGAESYYREMEYMD